MLQKEETPQTWLRGPVLQLRLAKGANKAATPLIFSIIGFVVYG